LTPFSGGSSKVLQNVSLHFGGLNWLMFSLFDSFVYFIFSLLLLPLVTFSIYDCLDRFTFEDQFDNDNKMNCDMCGLKNRSMNKCNLWKTPKILILHIKRFMTNSYGIPTQKITNNIIYPIKDLDLSKYFDPYSPYKDNSKYDLFGVNIHQAMGYGRNINAGHYTSLVKNIINNKWYLYNDSNEPLQAMSCKNLQDKIVQLHIYLNNSLFPINSITLIISTFLNCAIVKSVRVSN
jgi:ubiquitin C-terminal hydrolase